jgi:predicted cytidylate kinase
MIITISGFSGSGKTTVATLAGERLKIPAIDVGQIFRGLAAKHGMDVVTFGKYAEKHPEIDRQLDAEMIKLCRRKKDLILQGRLAGWMTKRNGIEALRVWIGASAKTRAARICHREGIRLAKACADTLRRDEDNRRRYLETYGLDLNDLSIYDSVIQTDNLTIEGVVSALMNAIRKVWPKKLNKKTSRRPANRKRPRKKPLQRRRAKK